MKDDWAKQLKRDRFIYKWKVRLGYVALGFLMFFASKGIGDFQESRYLLKITTLETTQREENEELRGKLLKIMNGTCRGIYLS